MPLTEISRWLLTEQPAIVVPPAFAGASGCLQDRDLVQHTLYGELR